MSTPPTAQKIWHNGKFIEWNDAQLHVMSHVVHYASSLFEGIRCYATPQGPAVFRLREHIRRLHDSCHIYRMDPPYSIDELIAACLETVSVNDFKEHSRYRMTGSKSVRAEIKKANRKYVAVTGRVQPGPKAVVKGTKVGGTSIGIGVAPSTSSNPEMPYTPTIDVDSIDILAEKCDS